MKRGCIKRTFKYKIASKIRECNSNEFSVLYVYNSLHKFLQPYSLHIACHMSLNVLFANQTFIE